jgi:hypothetical protein
MMRRIDNSPSFSFPLPAGGTAMCAARFPSRSGGNLKEGGNQELWLRNWYNKKEGKRNLPPSLA